VTTLQYAFAPACTAEELQNRTTGCPFSAPRLLFWRGGSMLGSPPAALFCSGPASRSGLSLASNDCLSPGRHSRFAVPGLLLRCPAGVLTGPFGPSAPSLVSGFLGPVRARSMLKARYPFPFRRFGCLLDLHYLSGEFSLPVWIAAFNPASHRKAALRTPDFLSLPWPAAVQEAAPGSSFQIRMLRSALLFREPLGTLAIMP